MSMPQFDQLFLDLCDFLYKTPDSDKVDVTRTSLLAAQYTANRRAQQRMLKAVEKRASERKALARDNSGTDTSVVGGGELMLSPTPAREGES